MREPLSQRRRRGGRTQRSLEPGQLPGAREPAPRLRSGIVATVLRFLLRDAKSGDATGEFRVAQGRWGLGDVFTDGDGRKLRIVDMLEDRERLDVAGVWLVEPAERPR